MSTYTSPLPVSIVSGSIPLPSGASTAANQALEITQLIAVNAALAAALTIQGTVTANQGAGGSSAWKVDGTGGTFPISGSISNTSFAATQGTSPWVVSGPLTDTQLRATPVPVSGSITASGTVTANAGTNLNTSALALETGGNLATIAGYLTPKAIKTVTGAISATTTIVTAVTAKRIKVVALSLITASTTAVTVTMKSAANGTGLWTIPMQAITGTNFGVNLACSAPSFLFATAAGALLEMSMSTAQTVTYSLSYFDDDAS